MSGEQVKESVLDKLSYQQVTDVLAAIERTLQCRTLKCIRDSAVTCNNGHGVCTVCAMDLQACPKCSTDLSAAKSTMLNILISLIPRPCKHSLNGCDQIILYSSDDHNERFCGYREMWCRVKGCKWEGIVRDLLNHLKSDHPKVLLTDNNPVVKLQLMEDDIYYYSPVYAFGYIMWAMVWYHPDNVQISVEIEPEIPCPEFLAVISLRHGDIKFTDTIVIENSTKFIINDIYYNSKPYDMLRSKFSISKKLAHHFVINGYFTYSLKIIENIL